MQSHAGDDLQDLEQIIAKPKRETCSKSTEDCFATGCCDIVGYNCFTTKPEAARYRNCTGCVPVLLTTTVSWTRSEECCTSETECIVLRVHEGPARPASHELDLQHQYREHLSIFHCNYSEAFSDASVKVGPG